MGQVIMSGIVPQLTVPATIPDVPTEWEFYQAISADTEWTAPNPDEWYRIWVIGESGTGGYYNSMSHSSSMESVGCAGGNSGGLAGSILYGDTLTNVPCTVNNSITSFGSLLSATSGGSGGTESMTSSSSHANQTPSSIVGEGSGGNLYNLSGYKGGAGGAKATAGSRGGNSGALGGSVASSSYTYRGGGGGGGARLPIPYDGFPYVATASQMSAYQGGSGAYLRDGMLNTYGDLFQGTTPTAYPSVSKTAPVLYGGGQGKGGCCWMSRCWDSDEEDYDDEVAWPTKPGYTSGSPGLIIIERGVYK